MKNWAKHEQTAVFHYGEGNALSGTQCSIRGTLHIDRMVRPEGYDCVHLYGKRIVDGVTVQSGFVMALMFENVPEDYSDDKVVYGGEK